MTTTTVPTADPEAVACVVANLRAAGENAVYDPTDPIQVAAVEQLRSEAAESLTLPREVFINPQALVDLLADSAEHHGWTVDRSDETRRALLHTARTLQYLLIPGGAR